MYGVCDGGAGLFELLRVRNRPKFRRLAQYAYGLRRQRLKVHLHAHDAGDHCRTTPAGAQHTTRSDHTQPGPQSTTRGHWHIRSEPHANHTRWTTIDFQRSDETEQRSTHRRQRRCRCLPLRPDRRSRSAPPPSSRTRSRRCPATLARPCSTAHARVRRSTSAVRVLASGVVPAGYDDVATRMVVQCALSLLTLGRQL